MYLQQQASLKEACTEYYKFTGEKGLLSLWEDTKVSILYA